MSWPLSQDYNEAIQSPSANFADADLRRGEAVCNALGLPMPSSGNFADVYQVRCPDGGRWAVKCFTREAVGLRERYHEISQHLRRAKLPFTVDFAYLEKGIRVGGQWYPVVKMQWVEGLTLNQFVAQSLEKPALLEALSQMWGRMGAWLRAAEVGHCDLQHGNVLLAPGAGPHSLALKLIDYDGMWVPALAGKKSGEVGHPSYQHPGRARDEAYNIEVDRFPLLLVAAALRALKVKGRALWQKYDNGDNLLFKEADLREPAQSALFRELTAVPEPKAAALAARLRAALDGGLESVPLLEEAPPDTRLTRTPPPASHGEPEAAPNVELIAPAADDPLSFASSQPAPPPDSARGSAARRGLPAAAWVGGGAALAVVAALGGALAVWALTDKPAAAETSAAPRPTKPPAPAAPPAAEPKKPVEVSIEGESLIPRTSSNFKWQRQEMGQMRDGKWSGDAQLWATPRQVGDFIDLELPVPAAGRYKVVVYLTRARDYGVVQFSLDGKPLGEPIDCFEPARVLNSGPIELGSAELKKGNAALRIEVAGTNKQSVGARYMFGLDLVVLKPAPP